MFAGMKAVRYTAASHTVDASGVARVKSTAARQGNAAATSGMTGSFQGVAVVQDGDAVQKQHILIFEFYKTVK